MKKLNRQTLTTSAEFMSISEQAKEFTRLWTRAQPAIAAFISSMIPDYNEADDVLQQVSVTLLDHFDAYDRDRPFVPWAVGFAKYEILNSRRRRATDRHVFDSEALDSVAEAFVGMEAELGGISEALRKCLKSIQGKAREAFDLRYAQDAKPPEIADRLSMSTNAVGVLLHRTRNFLRRCVKHRIMIAGLE